MPTPSTTDRSVPDAAAHSSAEPARSQWDHSTHDEFYQYYAQESQSEAAVVRFRAVRDTILRLMGPRAAGRVLDVADVGCGAGMQSLVWAEADHAVHALDINEPLVQLGRERAAKAGKTIDFQVGSATRLPWADETIDVCIALELIEHVADWEGCVREFGRVVRPGGVVFLTTTNQLCPWQEEFNLPLYSWYPARWKRHYEELAVTSKPELANFAKYPAVNWFTFYGLRSYMAKCGFDCMDRFDMMDLSDKGTAGRLLVEAIRRIPPMRFAGQVATPGTRVLAIKRSSTSRA